MLNRAPGLPESYLLGIEIGGEANGGNNVGGAGFNFTRMFDDVVERLIEVLASLVG